MRTLFKLILVLAILAAGGGIAKWLIETKPVAKRKPISIGAPLVEITTVKPGNRTVTISAMGTVIPSQEMVLQPQVSGKIIDQDIKFVPGGIFLTGEQILKIDPRDYEIALNVKKAELIRTMSELEIEQNRQSIALKEWELLGSEVKTSKAGRDMALRKPYLQSARAILNSAKSGLIKAQLEIKRTTIRAPFNSTVKDKYVDLGQTVSPGTRLATLVGTDEFWVQISVPTDQLPWISIPDMHTRSGSRATVIQEIESRRERIRRDGRVIRLLSNLDPVGRMARLLVTVQDPLGLSNDEKTRQIPLLLGAYVRVEIYGPKIKHVFEVSRKALRENNHIWIMTPQKTLKIKKVEVIWREKDSVLVRGLKSGEQIIVSRIPAPVAGMKLRLNNGSATRAKN